MINNIDLKTIKNLSYEELDVLAKEIREEIISVVSKNGGHLASNLGIVELTIALHKVFDSPKDKIIFDVSHQSYTHKILTGRINEFKNLRKFEGVSGFSKYNESVHDVYEAGHSSTAISAGLGFLEAKKTFPNEIGDVIAVVGDASIVNGVSFEALNYLGYRKDQKMIIILNDNEMGISKNVGSLAKSYDKIRTKGKMTFLRKITPLSIKKALKSTFYDIGLFNSLGFQYFEKIDGHNIKELVKYLTFAKNYKSSVVLHIITAKGKGYKFAEEDSCGKWHGVGPFDITTGEIIKTNDKISYGEILSEYLVKYVNSSENGKKIRVITPAMTLGSGLTTFANNCKNQFIDVGIAEESAAVMAGAMSRAGLIPIYFCYATFLQRAYDEIQHDIARPNEHVIFCIDHVGIVSDDGDTHQGIFDLSYLTSIPGITILTPKDGSEAISMLKYAIEELNGPVAIRYSKEKVSKEIELYEYKPKWDQLFDANKTVITYGILYNEVKKLIENSNLNVGLINASIINPLDEKLLLDLANFGKEIIVYEETYKNGSLGSLILNFYNKHNLKPNIKLLSLDETYLEVGKRSDLLQKYKISLEDLKKVIGD